MSPEELEILVKDTKEKVETPLEEQLIQIAERKTRALAALGLDGKRDEAKNKIGF